MGILILLTIFLILVKLVGLSIQEAKLCPLGFGQIAISAIIKNNLRSCPFICAVKLARKETDLLNIVFLPITQKVAKSSPVYTIFSTIKG